MSNKENNFKEQFKQALISTAKVISDDYKVDLKKIDKNFLLAFKDSSIYFWGFTINCLDSYKNLSLSSVYGS